MVDQAVSITSSQVSVEKNKKSNETFVQIKNSHTSMRGSCHFNKPLNVEIGVKIGPKRITIH